ncbi:ABC transporter substrate-binding protein [Spirosoma spitsbergense]|uniref:ABC transporter substrate-binding protein n=1 Tax=Spirosoma spitsbergense TaxID=431554 RepID=UPI00037B0D15|nr:ABC transporter substrate-binding protein [Spirosoma spitsbergense]
MKSSIRLALDWTPNTNHTGFYVALATGAYKRAGLDVRFLLPDEDGYELTPAKRLTEGGADLAIAPSESVFSYQANRVPVEAVAAVLARDASAIVTLKASGLDRPGQLDGKVYASYAARYEDDIIRQMIRNDGGTGQFVSSQPARLAIWQALLSKEADATWIFLPWEGVEAEVQGIELNQFLLNDYAIPYGYSPVLIAHRDWAGQNADTLRQFLAATAEGFTFAAQNPDEAARMLIDTANHPTLSDNAFVKKSQRMVSSYYLNEVGQWGKMEQSVWESFTNFLIRSHLLTDANGVMVQHLDADTLFTNEYL